MKLLNYQDIKTILSVYYKPASQKLKKYAKFMSNLNAYNFNYFLSLHEFTGIFKHSHTESQQFIVDLFCLKVN